MQKFSKLILTIINNDTSLFAKDVSLKKERVMWQDFPLIISFLLPFLRDESGANAVEYALIMALVAVFIIAGSWP